MDYRYYVYCISNFINGKNECEIPGFENACVFCMNYRDIGAFISETSKTSYDITFENLKCHEDVIMSIWKENVVLPMRFSTICSSFMGVEQLLEKYYFQFKENIKRVENKVELGIKVFCNINYDASENTTELKTGKDYLLDKYKKYIDMNKTIEPYIKVCNEINEKLSKLSAESSYKNPMKNNLIMNASYLVNVDKMDEFTTYVEDIKIQYDYLKIIYSGPWPPYNFVNVKEAGVFYG